MSKLAKAADAIESFIDWTGRLTSWLILVLVVLIAVEVLLRYTISFGAVWAQELEWHLLAVIALWGIAYTQKHDAHVRVDIVYQSFSQRTKDWMEFLSASCLMAPMAFYFAWLAVRFVAQSYSMGEISPDPGGLTNRWILKSFVISGFVLLGIQSIAMALRSFSALMGHRTGVRHADE
ncbi:MAG: TRAP transporter small permease subunit [Zoogloeaceae bacterium]|nr:TRAP transporter small permease subunit [Zoogloeaceae bacterium]